MGIDHKKSAFISVKSLGLGLNLARFHHGGHFAQTEVKSAVLR
jgi:hypothetical protein